MKLMVRCTFAVPLMANSCTKCFSRPPHKLSQVMINFAFSRFHKSSGPDYDTRGITNRPTLPVALTLPLTRTHMRSSVLSITPIAPLPC